MTIAELAAKSGVSSSHITRIERGERNPSGMVLRKLAEPLGMAQEELFTIAGYLPQPAKAMGDAKHTNYAGRLDPDIARFLAREPRSVQRSVIPLIRIIENLGKASRATNQT